LWAALASGAAFTSLFALAWNTGVHFAIFLVVVFLISVLRNHLLREKELARTDVLTGALNNRAFYEAAKIELDRARRYGHPFTVAYIDLDHFKDINASFGYSIGDAVLRTVSRTISTHIRTVDILARLGGDEFALLLPETGDQAAQAMLPRLHGVVTTELQKGQWDLTLSMGATIFLACPSHVDDIIHMADHAMYKVKRDSQNAIRFTVYDDPLE
jgi:diguanylate cyclase (GGDEF)-like protein